MPLYKIGGKFLGEAEIMVHADGPRDAMREASEKWPDGHWRCQYGGAELKPPDKSSLLSTHVVSIETDPQEDDNGFKF